MSLDNIRSEIDKIDAELIPLLSKRLNCSLTVAEIKKSEGIPVLDVAREEAIIAKVREKGGKYGDYIAGVYQTIMDTSKELQHDSMHKDSHLGKTIAAAGLIDPNSHTGKVICQGAKGAFSAEAAGRIFPSATPEFVGSFRDVFEAVERGDAKYGIVPVENSNAGSVSEVYDLLMEFRHYIVRGIDLKISQNLLGVKGAVLSDIEEVYSHPQGIAQSAAFIKSHGLTATEYSNTAVAARMIAEAGDKTKAAIGSLAAAEEYGLDVLARDIQSAGHNSTRFIAISKQLELSGNSNKVSLVFAIPHVTGSLCRILGRFSSHGLNLTKLESRMAAGGDFHYLFYLDFTGNVQDENTVKLICEMSEELPDFAFLGNYNEIPYKE